MEYVLITGSASGLGLEFAKIYAKDEQNLILVDMNEEGLKRLKSHYLALIKKLMWLPLSVICLFLMN